MYFCTLLNNVLPMSAVNSVFSFLKPKENKFFPLVNEVGVLLENTGKTLVEFICCNDKEKMTGLYRKIKNFETESDHLINVIFEELNNTFITPFDREDIHELCERLDDTLDAINSASKRVLLFQPKRIPPSTVEICKVILECCSCILIAVQELKTINKKPAVALAQCEKLHDLEQRADELYEEYVKYLFETENDSIELVKIKEIMQELERTTDMANAVGKIIKTIIVKYA